MLFPIGDNNSSRRAVPVVTYGLIALNVLVFFIEMNQGEPIIRRWSVTPRQLVANPTEELPTIITSIFHACRLDAPAGQHALPPDFRRQRRRPVLFPQGHVSVLARGGTGGVAYVAHIGGFVAGMALAYLLTGKSLRILASR